jgi:hypothetical protein
VKQRDRFKYAADVLVRESGVTIRKHRKSNTGVAYTHEDDWGIEAPEPVGPVSFATFAHEIGHQLMHRGRARIAWLNEIEAWEFALAQFDRFDLPGVERARKSAAQHLRYVAGRSGRRAKPETARAILDRYPAWVFVYDDPREAVTFDVFDLLTKAAQA